MKTEIISLIGIILAGLAFVFSIFTFILHRRQTRKELVYKMLYDLNIIVIDHTEVSQVANGELTQVQSAYSSMVWNFVEAVYNLNLQNDKFLEPSINQLAKLYRKWYVENKNSYGSRFQKFIYKKYKI